MRTIHRILILILVGALVPAGLRAQNNYFSIVNSIPHLPVFANTAAVASPKPGAMVYSDAEATVMVYSGDTWDSFCTQQLALTTGAYAVFTVAGGIPYLPVKTVASVTSTTGTSGTLYYPSDQAGLRINNSQNWFTPNTLVAPLAVTSYATAGNLPGLAGGVAIPVLAANPSFVATDKGAIYLNSADLKLHVNNGTAWVAIDCGACPAIADGVTVNVDDPVNMTNITGGFSYFQKTGIAEGTHLYRWRVATDAAGADATLDPTTTIGYTPGYSDALDGKYLQFEVRPRATGLFLGTAATSPWTLIKNCPPQINGVLINGDFDNMMANTFTLGGYSYYDAEGNAEATTGQAYRWFLSTGANGSGTTTALNTDAAYTYTYTDADDGKYLNLGVITKAAKGYSTSAEGVSSYLLKNCPPQAAAALLTPVDTTYSTATQLPLSYTYYDKEGNLEGASVLTYYKADNAAGTTNKTQLATGTSVYTYTFADADQGKYLLADVLPKAATGFSTGTLISSPTVKIWNCPPQVSGLLVDSSDPGFSAATTVGVSYTYFDKEANAEGSSEVTLYKADDASGLNKSQVATGASVSYAYNYADADQGKYFYATVTPKATAGYSTGSLVSGGAIQIWNCPPQASGIIDGDFTSLASNTFTNGGYSYFDKEGDPENTGALAYRWFLSTGANGTGATTLLNTSTAYTYTYTDADDGKYLNLGVKVGASKGFSISDETIVSGLLKNCPPQVSGVLINGTLAVGQALTAGYAYYDSEGNAEGASAYQWYRATDALGTGKTAISGATSATYTLVAGDSGKFIGVGVTPKATTGYSTGTELITYTATAIP